ncbi:Leukemia NUP98 fusion partner 1 [Camelus dromedarius]|uniref:Leukemia NUP98 fusion partner 1 n=1 Tax=Camelus dromedarius TaxID=9838 RepID=A0A5N4EKB5_CAMDR|nr:Leukemia NUP98 fusion partner 1 [Camelus dromedarius]
MEHKDDDDDDVSFAKWMSSFWGHSWIEEEERGLRDRHGSQDASYRKTSLPCPEKGPTDQEDKISVQHETCLVSNLWTFCLRANIVQSYYIVKYKHFTLYSQFPVLPRIMSSDSHPRRHSYEDQGVRSRTHVQDYRKCSGDGSFKESLESKGRSHSKIQAFSESSEEQLCFRTKRSVSLGPESRKERNERECWRLEMMRSRKKVEERRSSRKEEREEAHTPALPEKGPE